MIRVIYVNEPGSYRHVVEFSDWKVDQATGGITFTSEKALKAKRIKFAAPDSPSTQK